MKKPLYFLSHGGGPWPWIPEMKASYPETVTKLRELGQLQKPRAVVILSSHWEENEFSISTGEKPSMIYDYSGFPPHTYQIQYPAPGDPKLASEILKRSGIPLKEDSKRGFDHGTFVPLYCIFPDAQIPVVQLSIEKTYDPEKYFKLGEALGFLRDENVLFLGSGLTYHNLRKMFAGMGGEDARLFGEWLTKVLKLPSTERKKELLAWEKAPGARASHPREDHLMPLFTIVGAAGADPGEVFIREVAMGVEMLSFKFSQ